MSVENKTNKSTVSVEAYEPSESKKKFMLDRAIGVLLDYPRSEDEQNRPNRLNSAIDPSTGELAVTREARMDAHTLLWRRLGDIGVSQLSLVYVPKIITKGDVYPETVRLKIMEKKGIDRKKEYALEVHDRKLHDLETPDGATLSFKEMMDEDFYDIKIRNANPSQSGLRVSPEEVERIGQVLAVAAEIEREIPK